MKSLQGKTILVTGAAGGLGQEYARQLLARGAHLILTDLDERLLQPIADQLKGSHGKILDIIGADISNEKGCGQLYGKTKKKAPNLDMLINNAWLINYGYFWEIPPDKWETLMKVNLFAPMWLSRLFVPDMTARGDGHLVFMSSVAGFAATALGTPYTASKFGLRGFAMALSGELKNKGVRTTIVYPSGVSTKLLNSPEFGFAELKPLPSIFAEDPVKVIRAAIKGIRKNRLHVYPGLFAKIVWQAAKVRPIVSKQTH